MFSADVFNIKISGCRAGADWRIVIPLGEAFTLQPTDVLRMHIREKMSSPQPVLRLTSQAAAGQGLISLLSTGPDEGSLVLEVDDAITAGLSPALYVFDIEINRAGVIDVPFGGTIEVINRITRGA